MAQQQFAVGTQLTTPTGGTYTVSDPNQFFATGAGGYNPVQSVAPVVQPLQTQQPIQQVTTTVTPTITPTVVPTTPKQPTSLETFMASAQYANAGDGTIFKDAVSGQQYYKRQGTLRGIGSVDQLQDLARQGIVIPGSDITFGGSPQTQQQTPQQVAASLSQARSAPVDRILGPTEYKNIREMFGVDESNFSTFFRKVGNDILLKGSAPMTLPQNRFSTSQPDSFTTEDTSTVSYSLPEAPTSTDVDPFLQSFITSFQESQQQSAVAEQERTDLIKKLESDYALLGGKAMREADLQRSMDLQLNIQKVKELNLIIAQKVAAYQAGANNIQNQPIPQGLLVGQQAALQRQQAVEIGSLTSQQQALLGNIDLARQTAKDTVDMEFAPIENDIQRTLDFLKLNEGTLAGLDKKKTDGLNMIMALRKEQLAEQKEKATQINNLAIDVAKAGGDPSIISRNKSFEENLIAAAPYLKATSKADMQVIDVDGRKVLLNMVTKEMTDLGASDAAAQMSLQFNPVTGAAFLTNKFGVIKDPLTGTVYGRGSLNVPVDGNTRAQRNNNPANIKYGTLTKKWVEQGLATIDPNEASDGGKFLKFNDASTGMMAATDLLLNSGMYTNLTVNEAMKKWSNSGYDGAIAPELAQKRVGSLAPEEVTRLVSAMLVAEGFTKGTNAPDGETIFVGANLGGEQPNPFLTKDQFQAQKDEKLINDIMASPNPSVTFGLQADADKARIYPSLVARGYKPGSSGKPVEQAAAKVLGLVETVKPEIAALRAAFNKNYKGAVSGILTGTNRDLVKLVEQIADKIGRLRSGGAINKDEEARFKKQIVSLGDLAFGSAKQANAALDRILAEAESVERSIRGSDVSSTGKILIRVKATGKKGLVNAEQFDSNTMEKL